MGRFTRRAHREADLEWVAKNAVGRRFGASLGVVAYAVTMETFVPTERAGA
jgi:hypothetical protein